MISEIRQRSKSARENAKPHLYRDWHEWLCRYNDHVAYGPTPGEAYTKLLKMLNIWSDFNKQNL